MRDEIELTMIRQIKLPVSDLQRSVDWYRRLLALHLGWEFVEDGMVRGAVLVHRPTGFLIGLRDRQVVPGSPVLAGFDAFSIGVSSVDALHRLRDRCDRFGIDHGEPVDRGPGGWHLDVPDPDGTVVRFLSPVEDVGFAGVEFFADGTMTFYDRPRLEVESLD
jgi:catechol 2,3-dioxygenase-like lactoylglutathione lyase family enzyme